MTEGLLSSLPAGIWLIGLLPLLLLLQRLFTLAFVRRAEVFIGPLHDNSHRFARVDGGLLRTRDASSVTLDNGLCGSIRQRGDGLTEVSVDFEGAGKNETIGFIGKPEDGHHALYAGSSVGNPERAVKSGAVPTGGERDFRDLWMGARTDMTDTHGIWISETGLLFRAQRAGDLVALAPRGAATYILYDERQQSPEETPLSAVRSFWDLLLPGAFVFLCLYPWLGALNLRPATLYVLYAGIVLALWGVAVWLESLQRDRVSKWLHLINRNTGLARWNGFVMALVVAVCAVAVAGGKFAVLPFALVIGTAVATNWARFTAAPWAVREPSTESNTPES